MLDNIIKDLLFEDLHHLSQQRIENRPRYNQLKLVEQMRFAISHGIHNHVRYILGIYVQLCKLQHSYLLLGMYEVGFAP